MVVERTRIDALRAPWAYHSPKRGRGTFENPQSRYPAEETAEEKVMRGKVTEVDVDGVWRNIAKILMRKVNRILWKIRGNLKSFEI
jgi:alpha-L-fucosidase